MDLRAAKKRTFWARFKCFSVLFVLALLEIGPVPIAPFFGIYLCIWRPPWFQRLVNDLYAAPSASS